MTIDFLKLLFDDSTIQPAQQALLDGAMNTFETYETEYDLIHRPLFSWNQEEARPLAPGERLTLNVQCFGKVGWYVRFCFTLLRRILIIEAV